MIVNQAYLFLIFTINGIFIGLLFDFFRILRRSFKTPDIITYLEDILFWILTGFILLYSIFTFSNGEVRFYMFLGVFIGCLLYMLLLSNKIIKVNVKFILAIKKVILKILSILAFPFKIFFKFIKNIIIRTKNTKFLKNKKEFWKKSRNIYHMLFQNRERYWWKRKNYIKDY